MEKNLTQLNVFGVGVTILMEKDGAEEGHTVTCIECNPGTGAPLHRHPEREAFYVLDGEVILEVEGLEHTLHRGQFMQVESLVTHRFMNRGKERATMLNVSIPSGHAKFFRDADALFRSRQFTPEKALAVSLANGIEILTGDS